MKRELMRELTREYARQKRETKPLVLAALEKRPLMSADMAVGLVVSQNVIRDCMIHVTNQAMPQQRPYFLELAVRLACYLITALPLEEQEQAAILVREGIMNKLGDMQSAGHGFKTEWGD